MGTKKSRQPRGASSQENAGKKGLSRRSLLKAGATGIAAAVGATHAGIAGAVSVSPPPPTGPDLAFVNGKIHTMDAKNTIVSSVTIKDGRFAEVGHGGHPDGPNDRVINLNGRTVIPGIIDCHNHIVLMGNRPGYHTPLENAYSIADVQQIYAARAVGAPPGVWITTIGGFHFNQFAEGRLPTASELDAAVPAHPVFIEVGFTGPSVTNSVGKASLQSNGVVVGADGSIATGIQSSTALLYLRRTLLQLAPDGFEQRMRSALDALGYGASLGVTTHLDQGAFQATGNPAIDGSAHEDNYTMHLPFLELYREGAANVRLRINFLHMDAELATPQLVQRLLNAFPFFGGDMVRTGGIGEFIAQYPPAASFPEAAKRIAQARWRAEVHSLTRTDFQPEIQGFEAANTVSGIGDLRWVVAHVPFITEDYVNRLKALGGGVNLTSWRYLAGTAVNNGPPFQMIVANGINAGMSSDGMQIAPMNPWIQMYYATTGVNALGNLINDGQQVTREQILRLYTAANGWFLREEDDIGTIEVGKFADLVVLSDDFFSVTDAALKHIRSIMTVVAGQIVHDEGVLGKGGRDDDRDASSDRTHRER